jgi:Nuclease-related domain
MGNARQGTADAGSSALAEWRRAQSLARRRLAVSAGLAAVACGLVVLAWWRRDVWVAGTAIFAVMAAWRLRPDPDADRWLRGAEAEMATAALLRKLPRRWVVLHDRAVPGSRANIDHLVISSTGVWVVDTKSARAPLRIRRGAVWSGEHPIDTGPAAWEAEVVSEWLGVDALAVVAVHGDGLRRRGKVSGGVPVVPASRLVRRLRRSRRVLTRAQVALLADRAAQVLPPRCT